MKLKKFNLLNQVEQEELLFEHGIFLSNHEGNNLLIDLYKLNLFYVECCYQLNKNEIAKITACDCIDLLPCLQTIQHPVFSYN